MSIALPGYVPDVHTADALDPAWGNAIRDRATQIFDTTTNRDAAITVPQVGQVGVLTTLSTAGLYVYTGAVDLWRPPWNLAWGVVGQVILSALSQAVVSTTAIDVTGASVTFTAVANRLYEVTGIIPAANQSGTLATVEVLITDGSNNVLSRIMNLNLAASSTGARGAANGCVLLGGIPAGSYTVKLRAMTSAGTCTLTGAASGTDPGPALLMVQDIGPNGIPS